MTRSYNVARFECYGSLYCYLVTSEDDNPGGFNNDIPPPKPPRSRGISLASVDAVQ